MYVIVVYDIAQQRVGKVCRYLRTKLNWIQNSVFEGELTNSQFMELENELKKLIDLNADSVLVFRVQKKGLLEKNIVGIEKSPVENIF